MGHRREVLVELVDESRFPDSGFAEDDDGLPRAVLRPLPTIDENRQLDLAADEARQASRRDGEPAAHPARLHDAVQRHRLAHALQHLRPAVLDHEQPGHQALRRGGDHHRVGRGRVLHARRDVRGLAEDLAVVRDHDRPGVQTDAHGQARPVPGGEGGVERLQGVHDRQARPDRPFRVVLARGGPAEVDEQTIAEFPGDVAAEAPDGAGGSLLVLRDEDTQLLGVELLREWRRADQVAEQNGQLPALPGWQLGFGLGSRRRSAGRWRHGREPLAAPAAELVAGLARNATRRTDGRERSTALGTEAPFGPVVLVTGRAAERAVNLHERLGIAGPNVPASPPRVRSVSMIGRA